MTRWKIFSPVIPRAMSTRLWAGTTDPLRASATETDVTVTSQLARGDGRTESYVPTYQEGRWPSLKIITYQEGNGHIAYL